MKVGVIMNIEKEINDIKERNKRVELNKEWETSWTRRICIMVLTYIVVSSLVPVIGFTLSTLSLNAIRKIWETRR